MNRLLSGVLFIFFSAAITASAQNENSQILSTPLAGSVVLRDVEDKYDARVISFEAPDPDGNGDDAEYRKLKEQVNKQFPYRRNTFSYSAQAKTTAAPLPTIVKAFVPDSLTGIPPDNHMAVNNGTDGVNVLNSSIAIVNTSTGNIALRKSLFSFSSAVGLNNSLGHSENFRYDPKVMYDPEADRFICVMLNGTNEFNYIVFGFSQSNDPTGAWNFYKLYGDYAADTTWFDYPTVAMTHNEFFLTGNKLVYNGSFQTGFRKSVIYQVRKSDGYAGAANLGYRLWDAVNYGGAPIRNIFPVKGGAGIKGPAQYFLSVRNMDAQNDSVFLLKIPDTMGTSGIAVSVTGLKSNLVYGFPPNGRQQNTINKLQTNDARVLGAFYEGNEIQFVSTTVQPSTGADAIYHGRISNFTSSPAVTADYITIDTLDFGFPNISYGGANSGQNSSIISFDYSGPKSNPGIAAVCWDGTAYSPLLIVKKGDSTIRVLTDSIQRWGDYTGSQPQWNKPGYIWIVGLYGKYNGSYSAYMAQLRSPFALGVNQTTNNMSPKAVLYPNPALQYLQLQFFLKTEADLHFALYSVSGKMIDAVLDAHCHEGKNEIQFNTASLAPGQYLLKGVSRDGQILVSKIFVKQ